MMFQETKENGFVMVRRNLLPHLIDGRLSMNDFAVYLVLILLADSDSGQTKTCARALHGICHPGQQLNLRGMQRILDRLDEAEYIHRDLVQGERGLYTITVNKYPITTGDRKGLNATLPHHKRCKKGVQGCTDGGLDHSTDHEAVGGSVHSGVLNSVHDATQGELRRTGFEAESVGYASEDSAPVTVAGLSEVSVVDTDPSAVRSPDPSVDPSPQPAPIQHGYVYGEVYGYALKASTKSEEQTEKDPKSSGGGSGILNPVKVGEVEGEERSSGEAPGKAKAEEEAPSSGKVLDPVTPEEALVQDMWTRLKSLPHFGRVQKQWTVTFRNLLREYTTETLHGAIAYAFDHKYWSRQLFRDDLDPVACFCEHLEEFTLKWASAQHQEELANSPVKLPPVTYLPSDEPVELPGGGIPGLQTATREENRQRTLKFLAEQERNKPSAEEIARLQAEADAQTLRRKAIVQFLNEDHAAQLALEQQALQQQALQAKKVTP